MSSSNEESELRKRSQAIDRRLEEDSRRLRRECKILLLGTHHLFISLLALFSFPLSVSLAPSHRLSPLVPHVSFPGFHHQHPIRGRVRTRLPEFAHTNRLFPIGSGESGKSTIVKQMKIIHQNGYTTEELQMYRLTIYKNVLDCAKALVGAMRQFDIEPELPGNAEYCDYIMEYSVDPDPEKPLDMRIGQAISAIWRDPCISKVNDHSSEFYMMDSAP